MCAAAALPLRYDAELEALLRQIVAAMRGDYPVDRRAIALLLLQGDAAIGRLVAEQEGGGASDILHLAEEARRAYGQPVSLVIAVQRRQEARRLASAAVTAAGRTGVRLAERLSRAMMRPATGIPILLAVLYFGLYQFVGVFGAGTVVDFIEGFFAARLNPAVERLAAALVPVAAIRDLFAGDYGIITLGVRYAIALILPIVGTFFIVFAVIEDSGYLPRLAMLIDRVFKGIGLNGRAVIPMVLGFGCDTMATIVTRTLETRRERVLTTLLLALAIPCSAQLGVILAILSGNPRGLLVWGGVVGLVLLLVGYLASRILPGERASFYMEIPPLRLPRLSNVLAKTYARMSWYFAEVLPLFILASVVIWIGQLTGLFQMAIAALEPLVRFIGLPAEAATAFLFGFFRRDYGAAGLFDLEGAGVLTGNSLVVAAVTLTLFLPCVAQFSVMLKERGPKTALAIAAFIFPFAFAVGFLLQRTLTFLGVAL